MGLKPTTTFVNYVYIINIKQQFRQLGIPLTVIFPYAACKLAHNNGHGPSPRNGWGSMLYTIYDKQQCPT